MKLYITLKYNLCDCKDPYILLRGDINVAAVILKK